VNDDTHLIDATENCSNIEGIAVSNNNEVTTLTNFVNEDCDQVTIRGALKREPTEFQTDVVNVTDVASYFSRPKAIGTYTYNQTTRSQITSFRVDNPTLQSTLTNFARVRGAFGYRATVCFRIQAISNPFQAGRVRMCFQPFYELTQHHDRFNAITPVSQLPGVELDLAESTSAILKVPYIHPYNYFRVAAESYDEDNLGTMSIFAYTPVALAAGTVAPKLTLWLWLEDFELIGAASTDLTAQSGRFKKDVSSKEADGIPGNVSNVLSAGANLTTWMGKKIPIISSYTGMASWALRKSAEIASSYGWSKPLANTPPVRMLNTNNVYQFNCDGPDPAHNLGTTTDNAVVPYPGFAGTDVDEMALSYITGIFAAISTPSLSVSDEVSNIIYACSLSPDSMYYSGVSINKPNAVPKVSGISFWPAPVYYMGNLFELWRGGFKFRIKISKTKFHTGRLLLGFNPVFQELAEDLYTPTTPNDMQFKSVIWDLREGNVMEFECPFIAPQAYLDKQYSYGTFFISVIDPLSGPDTVSTVCPMVIEVAGMDDFELAVPITARDPLAPLSTSFIAQAGSFEPTLHFDTGKEATHCIGEQLLSIKQLLSRAVPKEVLLGGSDVVDVTSNFEFPVFEPSPLAPTAILGDDRSYMAYFQAAYVMARGGFMVDVVGVRPTVFLSGYSIQGNESVDTKAIVTEERTALHLKMPYFNNRSRHLTTTNFTTPTAKVRVTSAGPNASARAIVYRRAAEDFQLGYFIGAPPLTTAFLTVSALTISVNQALARTGA